MDCHPERVRARRDLSDAHGTGCNLNRMPSSGLMRTRSQDEVDAGQSQDVTFGPASSRFEEW